MRILALALVAAVSSVSAESIAYLTNKGGGRIVITDEACSNPQKGKIAYTTGNTDTILGCWFIDDLYVHIVWADDGKLRSYPLENWTLMPKRTPGKST